MWNDLSEDMKNQARLATLLTLSACLTGLPGHAQPEPPGQLIRLALHGQPAGANIYAETVSNQGNLTYLGKLNQPFNLDASKFKYGLTLHIGGRLSVPPPPLRVQNYHGYEVRILRIPVEDYQFPKGIVREHFREGIYHFPTLYPAEILTLTPASGFAAQMQRTLFWFQTHPIFTAFLLLALGGTAVFMVGVYLPRHKHWAEEKARVDRFNTRLRNLDVKNDVFLARQFGEWATVQRLGAGGMAVVYKGVSTVTMDENEAVAIKVMNPDLASDSEYRRRFNREIQISKALDHPNIVRTIDWGEQDGVLYLVMEYIKGDTLRDKLPAKGFPLIEAMELALGIVHGLIHAHQRGVVHRDLKPDNIMVTAGNIVKVMDLGLAKREESENVTRTGDTFGTPAYMAPEQISGATLQPATDQYAFGVMLFEMVTGRRPFDIADSLTLVMKHLQEPPPRIREYKSQLPEELEAVIDKMLLKDPIKRYKSLVEVQIELTKIQRKYCPK